MNQQVEYLQEMHLVTSSLTMRSEEAFPSREPFYSGVDTSLKEQVIFIKLSSY